MRVPKTESKHREEAQHLSWDLILAIDPPAYVSVRRHLSWACCMWPLLPHNTTLHTHIGGEGGNYERDVALALKLGWMGQTETSLTGGVSGLLHSWRVHYELGSAVRRWLPLVHVLPLPSSTGSNSCCGNFKSCNFTADPSTTSLWNVFRNMERHGTHGKLTALAIEKP